MRLALKFFVWVVGLVALTLCFFVVFLATASDDFYRRTAQFILEQSLQREVRFEGTFSLTIGLNPTLVVTDVSLANASWAATQEMARLNRLEVQVALQPLLSRIVLVRRLVVEGLTLNLETAPHGAKNWDIATLVRQEEKPTTDLGYAGIPVIDHLSLKELTIIHTDRRSGRSMRVILASLDKRQPSPDGPVTIVGQGRVNQRPFTISGDFGSLQTALRATAPYPLELSLNSLGFETLLRGTVANLPQATGFDLDLSIRSASIGTMLDTLARERTLEGRAEIAARITGDLKALALTDLTIDFVGEDGQRLQASGALANLTAGTGLDVHFNASVPKQAQSLHVVPVALRELDDVRIFGRLTGALKRPALADVTARLRHTSGAELSVTGGLTVDLSRGQLAPADFTVKCLLSMPDATLLEQLAKVELPAVGSVQASFEASLLADTIVIDALRVKLGKFGGFGFTAEGTLGTISSFATGLSLDPELVFSAAMENTLPLVALAGLNMPAPGPADVSGRLIQRNGALYVEDLQGTIGTKDQLWVDIDGKLGPIHPHEIKPVSAIAATLRFGWPANAAPVLQGGQTLRGLGDVNGRIVITGTPDTLRLPDIRIEATLADGIEASAGGEVAAVTFAPRVAVAGLAVDVEARAATTAALAQRVGHTLPELGALRARGRLKGGTRGYALHDLVASAGPTDQPVLQVTGRVGDVLSRTGVHLRGTLNVPTTLLVEVESPTAAAKLGNVQGRFDLADPDGSLGLENLKIELVDSNLLTASLEGIVDDIVEGDGFKFQAALNVPDPAALGQVLGIQAIDVAPVAFTGKMSGDYKVIQSDGAFKVGQTAFSGILTGNLAGERPGLKARLTSPRLYFADFGFAPEPDGVVDEEQAIPPAMRTTQPVFSDTPLPFEVLKAVDLDLVIELDELDGVSLDIDKAALHVVLANGVLTIDTLRFNLVNGSMQVQAVVDSTPAKPMLHFEMMIDDLDLGDFLGQVDANVPLDGEFDLIMTVESVGRSPAELADSLKGQVDLAIERGEIRTKLFAFTALDLGSWLFARSTRRGYSELNCFVARFHIVDGEAESVMLMVDTTNVRMLGDGVIELDDERIKLDFTPRAKRRRIVKLTTPFSLEGPLSAPQLQVNTSRAAKRTLAEVVLTPINLLGRLLPLVSDHNKDLDNPCLQL